MKKFICVILTVIFLFSGTVAFAASIPNAVLDARGSTVYIEVDGGGEYWSGSGFAIGTSNSVEYIVTNYHVGGGDTVEIAVFYDDYEWVGATVAAEISYADYCVLKLDSPIQMKPLTLYEGDPSALVGEQVYAFGFPGVADEIFIRNGSTIDDVTITDGIVSAVKKAYVGTGETAVTGLQMNVAINFGNSGGPLVNGNGTVVGINTFGSATDNNFSGAISISELIPTLDQNNIPYKASNNILYSGTLWIILIVAGAVVLFLLWFFIFRKKFRRTKTVSLPEYIEKIGGRLEYDRAVMLIAPVAAQLYAMHREGRSHLAVYPQSIRVEAMSGKAVLHTGKKELLSGYSAPEQYQELAPTGFSTDMYQLGAVLYRLLTGERLPDAMSRMGNDMPVQNKIDLLSLLPGTKQALKLAIALNTDVRISNAEQFMTAFHITPEMAAIPTGIVKKNHEKLAPKKKKKIIVLSVIIAAVAAVCVCAGVFFTAYNKVIYLLDKTDYRQAEQAVSVLPDFGDVPVLKRISQAGNDITDGKFDEARELLTGIENHPYSQRLLPDIDLMQGLSMIAAGNAKEGEAYISSYIDAVPDADIDSINYGRAMAYMATEDYATAEKKFAALGDYEGAHQMAATCAAAQATDLIDQGSYGTAMQILKPYDDISEVSTIIDGLEDDVYQQGVDALNSGDFSKARGYFSSISGYEDADELLNALDAYDYQDLMPYLDYEFAHKLLFDSGMIYEYLVGYWTDGDYYFKVTYSDFSYSSSFDIPWLSGPGDYFEITSDGIYLDGGRESFQFEIIDEYTMDVYAFANGNTYRMYRQ